MDSAESVSFNSSDSASATGFDFGMYVNTVPTGSAMGMIDTPKANYIWIDNPWKVDPMPYVPTPTPSVDYAELTRQMTEAMKFLASSGDGVRKAIVKTDSEYHIKVELPGFDHSDVKVVRKNSEISIQLTHGDQAFEDDQYLENSLTDIQDDILFEIPCDFNPVPNRLRFRNGVLLMSFSRMIESEELSVEDAEPDILRDAVNEMKEDE